MNSAALQKQFPEVYRDFFSKNDLVVSGCFSFPWGPRSIRNTSNKFILKSCLPLRCYVGLKERKDKNVVFESAVIYSGGKSKFEELNPRDILKHIDELSPLLQKFLKERDIQNGYTISFLSEIEKGHSLGFSGTFPAIISSAFYILTKGISPELLEDKNAFYLSEIKEEVFRFAWKLEILLRKGRTFGQTIMHTLYGKSTPALYTLDVESDKLSQEEIDTVHVSFIPFEEILPKHNNFEIPFEYAILFSGIPSEAFRLEHSQETDIENINTVSDFMFEKIFPKTSLQDSYYQNLLKKTTPYDLFSDFIGILNSVTIKLFHELFVNGYQKGSIDTFLGHMNHLRNFLSITEPQSDFANDVSGLFHAKKHHPEENIGILPMYSGKLGGGYLIGLKPGISRATFQEVCTELQKTYPQLAVDYFSPIDGENSSGIQIEQNIQDEKYSEFIPKNQVRCIKNDSTTFLVDHKDIFSKNPEGILFDTITRKVYFNGEKLTSGDVPSQGTIVDIMNILINQIGEDISNLEFPVSSYTKNKNEMVGKIIIPIVRFLEQKTNLALPLICKGELSSFYLKLNPTSIPITVVRKI